MLLSSCKPLLLFAMLLSEGDVSDAGLRLCGAHLQRLQRQQQQQATNHTGLLQAQVLHQC
jgi:hypothetical protein